MTTPHIGVLFEFPTLNGGEHSMLAMLRELTDSKFRFTAVAPPDGPLASALAEQSIPTVPFCVRGPDKRKRDTDELTAQLQAIVRQQQFDVLHANSLSMSRLTGRPELELPQATARTGHLRDIVKLSGAAIKHINLNHGLIAVSHATRDFHVGQGFDPSRCHVIHNGVDSETFRRNSTAQIRARMFPDIPADSAILLNVGQICLRKNQLGLARSVCRLLQTRSDIYLVLAGARHSVKQESVEYEQAVADEFRSIGKPHHLRMLGFRDDIPGLMNAADVLVHTAHQEPFGRTLLEAASSELPIIATNVGGTPEMLRDGLDAVLVEPGDTDALCCAMNGILNDTDGARLRSQSARTRAAWEFSAASAAEKTAAFWSGQLAGVLAAE